MLGADQGLPESLTDSKITGDSSCIKLFNMQKPPNGLLNAYAVHLQCGYNSPQTEVVI